MSSVTDATELADVGPAEVGHQRAGLDAVSLADPGRGLLHELLATRDQHDVAAAARALVGERRAEPFRRARDQRPRSVLLVEVHGGGRYPGPD